jgi:hypothetical protein
MRGPLGRPNMESSMRPGYWVVLLLLTFPGGELHGQAQPSHHIAASSALWQARPLPHKLALEPGPLSRAISPDSTRRRPFFLPRPGEHTAYWVGFGTGLALSPLLWCEGSGCGAVSKASTSLLLAAAGAVSGLLLSRTF